MDDPAAVLLAPAPPPPPAAEPAARAPAPATGAHSPPAPAAVAGAGAAGGGRQIFSVELRPGETTIVSWKKLLKEAGPGTAPPPSLPAAAAASAPPVVVGPLVGPSGAVHPAENNPNDPSQSNRFNSVIEKIERLYMGKHSSDEEDMDDVPDDDQYDTEDSFIDDAELDEYFEVDNLATKHTGFFVNKGKLEQSEYGPVQNVVPDGPIQNLGPKKRRRRDSSSSYIENSREIGPGTMAVKAPKRNALGIGKNVASSELSSYREYHSEGNKPVKSRSNSPGRMQKSNISNNATGAEYGSYPNIPSKDVSLPSSEIKDLEKHKTTAPQAVNFARTRTNDKYPFPAYLDKDVPVQLDLPLKKSSNVAKQDFSNKMCHKEIYGASQFSGLATANNVYSAQTTPVSANRGTEGSGIKAKGTRLERAIRDLQNIVSEYRPQTLDVPDIDPNCQLVVKRRLPQEVKQKLARVARLSVNQGKISEEELINRLMGIVGHLVQRRTLKRNMKEMVESGICAKQEKADKFQQVKIEINEMIKARLATKPKVTEQKDDSADDFQGGLNIDERRALKGKFVLDTPLEDRICDLYDLYVEGMDEDKGPQSHKLYVELADLWPQGYMDKVEIRAAISRSKQRRSLLYRQRKVRNEERMKRRRLAAATKLRDGNPVEAEYRMAQQVIQLPIKDAIPSMTSTHTVYPVVNYGHHQVSRNADKAGEMSFAGVSDGNRSSSADIKRRKLGPDAMDLQANPLKAPQRHGSEKQKPPKRADEAKAGSSLPQTVLAVAGYDPQRPGYS